MTPTQQELDKLHEKSKNYLFLYHLMEAGLEPGLLRTEITSRHLKQEYKEMKDRIKADLLDPDHPLKKLFLKIVENHNGKKVLQKVRETEKWTSKDNLIRQVLTRLTPRLGGHGKKYQLPLPIVSITVNDYLSQELEEILEPLIMDSQSIKISEIDLNDIIPEKWDGTISPFKTDRKWKIRKEITDAVTLSKYNSLSQIPIYMIMSFHFHTALLILLDGQIYSIGLGYFGSTNIGTSPIKRHTSALVGVPVLKDVVSRLYQKRSDNTYAYESIVGSIPFLSDRKREGILKTFEKHHYEKLAFYSPDGIFDFSVEQYDPRKKVKITDIGVLTKKHIHSLQKFINMVKTIDLDVKIESIPRKHVRTPAENARFDLLRINKENIQRDLTAARHKLITTTPLTKRGKASLSKTIKECLDQLAELRKLSDHYKLTPLMNHKTQLNLLTDKVYAGVTIPALTNQETGMYNCVTFINEIFGDTVDCHFFSSPKRKMLRFTPLSEVMDPGACKKKHSVLTDAEIREFLTLMTGGTDTESVPALLSFFDRIHAGGEKTSSSPALKKTRK